MCGIFGIITNDATTQNKENIHLLILNALNLLKNRRN